MYQLIEPSIHCYRLGHRVDIRNKLPGPGKYEYCVVCTLGYAKAFAQFGDEDMADAFVRDLRQETKPMA